MKVAAVLLCVFTVAFGYYAPLLNEGTGIAGQYIVVFHDNATLVQRNSHFRGLGANGIAQYEIGPSFRGYAARLTPELLDKVRQAPYVKYVETDQIVTISQESCNLQTNAPWGLNRVYQKDIKLDETFSYGNQAGEGVDAYIVDTGIDIKHPDFGGRATWGTNTADKIDEDCQGHGTHVAGTVAGTRFGLAKKATLFAVKVLNCEGSGSYSGIISGLQWCAEKKKERNRPSVINMSLGGPRQSSLNDVVESIVKDAGILVVVAAGNENQDACNVSPASALSAFTVGATTVDNNGKSSVDTRATFSNWGTCVDIFAPGDLIESDYPGSKIATLSGTSMASPHVAGAAALHMSISGESDPFKVKDYLIGKATGNYIDWECTATATKCNTSPNLLLHYPCA